MDLMNSRQSCCLFHQDGWQRQGQGRRLTLPPPLPNRRLQRARRERVSLRWCCCCSSSSPRCSPSKHAHRLVFHLLCLRLAVHLDDQRHAQHQQRGTRHPGGAASGEQQLRGDVERTSQCTWAAPGSALHYRTLFNLVRHRGALPAALYVLVCCSTNDSSALHARRRPGEGVGVRPEEGPWAVLFLRSHDTRVGSCYEAWQMRAPKQPKLDAAVQAALEAWAENVQPTIRTVSRSLSEPGKLAEQTRVAAHAQAALARRRWRGAKDAAADIASSKSLLEAWHKLRRLLGELASGYVTTLGRVLVCVFFLNQAQEALDLHRYYAYAARTAPPRHKPQVPPYPYLQVLVVVPTALSCAFGYRVVFTALLLTIDMLREEGRVVSGALAGWFIAGSRPNELQVKKAAILGCIVMVLTIALRDSRGAAAGRGRTRDWVGLLEDSHAVRYSLIDVCLCSTSSLSSTPSLTDLILQKLAGKRASAALLIGRLLLALLFMYVGTGQVARIRQRSQSWTHRSDPSDGHDNTWLLLQFALSLPFAAGYKTRTVCVVLAVACVAECLTCWQYWRYAADVKRQSAWALGKYIHARSHFATNLAVAGGLLMLASTGPGRFTVDRMLKKDE